MIKSRKYFDAVVSKKFVVLKFCFVGGRGGGGWGGEAAALFFSALFRQENGLQQESI